MMGTLEILSMLSFEIVFSFSREIILEHWVKKKPWKEKNDVLCLYIIQWHVFHWNHLYIVDINSLSFYCTNTVYYSFTLQSSLKHPAESDFARQLVALSAGQVTVKLTVKPHLTSRSQVKGQRTLTDELQVEVSRCSYTVFHVVVWVCCNIELQYI